MTPLRKWADKSLETHLGRKVRQWDVLHPSEDSENRMVYFKSALANFFQVSDTLSFKKASKKHSLLKESWNFEIKKNIFQKKKFASNFQQMNFNTQSTYQCTHNSNCTVWQPFSSHFTDFEFLPISPCSKPWPLCVWQFSSMQS